MSPAYKPPAPHVVIVGGGLAGLAAAAALVDRGLRITLLESRPRLGGRASSFTDPVTGELVDNCQHVSMGCCTNLADFCRRVGIADLFRREPAFLFLGRDGRLSTLRAGKLPAPLHLAGSFLRVRFLGWGDKLRIAHGLACLALGHDERPGEPFQSWLTRHGQNARTLDLFWSAVLVSALNERLDQMDFGHARKVFVDGFLSNPAGFEMELPLVPLGDLYGARLQAWLQAQGVAVHLTAGARAVDCDDDGALRGLFLRDGTFLTADFVVLAVSFDRVPALAGEPLVARVPGLQNLAALQSSPITGVHLWFDRPVCPHDHVVTPGRLVQWVFNHTAIQGRTARGLAPRADRQTGIGPGEKPESQYLQVVISASYDLLPLDKVAIRDAVLADLAAIWPAAREARLLRWWVVTEHGATFAVRPGVDALRPPQRTPIDGLFLAGDWTATGWPATMEGAVRSGYLAAQGILEDLGRPSRLLRTDLARGRLARLLLGSPAESPRRLAFEELRQPLSAPSDPRPPVVPSSCARADETS